MFSHAVLHAESDVKCAAGGHGSTNTRHGHRGNVVHADVCRRLRDEHEGLVETEQMTLVGLDGTLDSRLLVVADEVARRPGDALPTESPEDICYHCSNGRFIVRLKLVLVLVLQKVSLHVEVEINFLVALELHHEERITRLSLAKWRIETDGDQSVHVVGFWQNHELLDRVELDLVVVCFTA